MTSILTGDIINSRKSPATAKWMNALKAALNQWGHTPKSWEIYRGDSFQLEVKKPAEALLAAITIKAKIKCLPDLNVRIGIGIGTKTYNAAHITQANGSAFVYSGEAFEKLTSIKQTLLITSGNHDFDYSMNTLLLLLNTTMDNWSVTSADFVQMTLANRELSQAALGKKMKIAQSSVSERQKRARFEELLAVDAFYRYKINQINL